MEKILISYLEEKSKLHAQAQLAGKKHQSAKN
jgi:hypothetical protein